MSKCKILTDQFSNLYLFFTDKILLKTLQLVIILIIQLHIIIKRFYYNNLHAA